MFLQAYVELNELQVGVWQETGRWVGFEENFNPTAGTWSPSHVSYLTFKSLIQLRKLMSTGDSGVLNKVKSLHTPHVLIRAKVFLPKSHSNICFYVIIAAVILDMNAGSLSSVAEKIADELTSKNAILANEHEELLRALLMKRR